MDKIVKKDFIKLFGEIEIPSDKSISHRAIIFSSLAKGTSVIKNFSDGQDPHSTINVFQNLGVEITEKSNNEVIVKSSGKFSKPDTDLYCGNSGSTIRLVSGILASQNFNSTLTGDKSLSSRPMKRIIEPLSMMGANIDSNNFKAPLKIQGQNLHAITYNSKLASAQVKSCILLAGLNIDGTTTFIEPYKSRNHSELMLQHMGANITIDNDKVSIKKSELEPISINICGDISSAAYFIVAALLIPNSNILLKNIGLNPTRTGIIDVIQKMGGNIELLNIHEECGEKVGDIRVKYSELNSCDITKEIIPRLIDEIPIITILATQACGTTTISGAEDLRNKESDRISCMVKELKKLKANIIETNDGMIIQGKSNLVGDCEINTYNDHRIAMSFYVAGLICQKEILIKDFEWTNISFPTFEKLFEIIKK